MASEPKPCGCEIYWLDEDEVVIDPDACNYPAALERIAELERQLAAERERVIEECAKFLYENGWISGADFVRRLAEKPPNPNPI